MDTAQMFALLQQMAGGDPKAVEALARLAPPPALPMQIQTPGMRGGMPLGVTPQPQPQPQPQIQQGGIPYANAGQGQDPWGFLGTGIPQMGAENVQIPAAAPGVNPMAGAGKAAGAMGGLDPATMASFAKMLEPTPPHYPSAPNVLSGHSVSPMAQLQVPQQQAMYQSLLQMLGGMR